MLRRYELTDDEWNRIVTLLPPENTGFGLREAEPHGVIFLSVMDHGKVMLAYLTIFFAF